MAKQSGPTSRIEELLDSAIARRQPLQSVTDAMRLVNSSGDNLPGIVVEQYCRHFVVHAFHATPDPTMQALVEYLRRRFDPDYLVVKRRRAEGGREHDSRDVRVVIDRSGPHTVVTEHGLRFHVDLNDTLNSGLFLDMRKNRRRMAQLSPGKDVLNCFAYTCSFGVHCRAAGAARVVNVDVSAKILDKGRRNYELNNLVPHENEFALADTIRYLKGAAKRDNRFDCVIVDPPTFARHQGKIFSITEALPELLTLAFDVLKPGGVLLAATNCTSIATGQLTEQLESAARRAGRRLESAQRLGQDADFPGSGTMKESFLSCLLATAAGSAPARTSPPKGIPNNDFATPRNRRKPR